MTACYVTVVTQMSKTNDSVLHYLYDPRYLDRRLG